MTGTGRERTSRFSNAPRRRAGPEPSHFAQLSPSAPLRRTSAQTRPGARRRRCSRLHRGAHLRAQPSIVEQWRRRESGPLVQPPRSSVSANSGWPRRLAASAGNQQIRMRSHSSDPPRPLGEQSDLRTLCEQGSCLCARPQCHTASKTATAHGASDRRSRRESRSEHRSRRR